MRASWPLACITICVGYIDNSLSQMPAIRFDSLTKSFTRVYEGEILRHAFTLRNIGITTLEIDHVEGSCGCTSVLSSRARLSPGQSTQIHVNIDTHGTAPFHGGRRVRWFVWVTTNAPNQNRVKLTVEADVIREFGLSQYGINLDDKAATREIVVTIPHDRKVAIVSADCTDQNVEAMVKAGEIEHGGAVRVLISEKPNAIRGYHFGELILKTTSTLNPLLRIPIRGTTTGP